MGKRLSRQHRNLNSFRLATTDFRMNNTPVSGESFRVYRNASIHSTQNIYEAVKIIKPAEVEARFGRYTLSLVHSGEIPKALRDSPRRNELSLRKVSEGLIPLLPVSASMPITADVLGLRQYISHIGIEVDYPEFDIERRIIVNALGSITCTNYCSEKSAHISIARGNIRRLTNLDKIEESLPKKVILSSAVKSLKI